MHGEFSLQVKRILAKRAGEMCSLCKTLTGKPHTNAEKAVNLGEAAHIRGLKDDVNLRYDQTMTDKMRSHISNAIWLCSKCHKEIDSDSGRFTVDVLNKIKYDHEQSVLNDCVDKSRFPEYSKLERELLSLKEELKYKQKSALEIKIAQLEKEKANFEAALFKSLSILNSQESEELSSYEKIKNILINENDIDKAIKTIDKDISKGERTLSDLKLTQALLLLTKKDLPRAESSFKKSIDIFPNVENTFQYALFLSKQNKFVLALKCYKQALTLGKQRLDSANYSFKEFISIYMTISNIGMIYLNYRLFNEAAKHLFFAFEMFEGLYKQNKELFIEEYLTILHHLAIYYNEVGELDKAKQNLNLQNTILGELFAKNPDEYYLQYSTNLFNATILEVDAITSIKKLIEIEKIILNHKKDSNEIKANRLLSHIYFTLASNKSKINENKAAKLYYRKTINLLTRLGTEANEENKPLMVKARCNLGILLSKNNPKDGIQELRYAEELCSSALERNNDTFYAILLGQIYHNLAIQFIDSDIDEALKYAKKALIIRRKITSKIRKSHDFDLGLSTLLKGEILVLCKKPFINTIKSAKQIFEKTDIKNLQPYIARCDKLLERAND